MVVADQLHLQNAMLLAQAHAGCGVVLRCPQPFQYLSRRSVRRFVLSPMYADKEPRSNRHSAVGYKANAAEFGMGSRRERTRSPAMRAVANPGEVFLRKHAQFRTLHRRPTAATTAFRYAEGGTEIQVARRIYVGNLSYSVAWQDLKDHFKPVGEGIRGCCHSGYR